MVGRRSVPPLPFALSLLVWAALPLTAQTADLVVTNGVIHTVDESTPRAEAMAILDGVIVAIGSAEEIAPYRGPETTVIDLEGRAVIPGLIDAHAHVIGLGTALRSLDLVGTKSAAQIAAMVRNAASERPAGEWITGRGWDQNDWETKEFPTHEVLDEAAPDNPVWLTRIDGHAGWANRRAIELAGITAATPDPDGGRIVRDTAGNPTGIFIDNAEALLAEAIPEPSPEELEDRLAAAQERMVSVGLTGVHDMGTSADALDLYRRWAHEGRLLPRIVSYLSSADRSLLSALDSIAHARTTEPGARFRIRGVKLYADGALGSRGAALLKPYSDDHENRGLLVTPPDSLRTLVWSAWAANLQPAIHAIGDRGNRVALETIEIRIMELGRRESLGNASAEGGGDPANAAGAAREARVAGAERTARELPPLRIEHAQVIALEDIPRFAALDVIASIQPTHATSDMYWAEDRLSPERIRGAYAWRKLLDAGVPLVCGSDFPVEDPNPFHGLHAAITRQDQEAWPAGGWYPEESLTREEALACFTKWAAAAAGMEDEIGTLSVGKRADFLVLDRDVMQVPPEEIWRTRVLRTVINGETVYEGVTGPIQ